MLRESIQRIKEMQSDPIDPLSASLYACGNQLLEMSKEELVSEAEKLGISADDLILLARDLAGTV